jgi:hypothetical protein
MRLRGLTNIVYKEKVRTKTGVAGGNNTPS